MKIVYLAPITEKKFGGVKVLFKHSELLNELDLPSEVFLIEDPNHTIEWFDHKAIMKLEPIINPQEEFLVLPEGCAPHFAPQCIDLGIKYGIFVQNPYQIYDFNNGVPDNKLDFAYQNSKIILAVSEYTENLIKIAFPKCANKVIKLYPGLNGSVYDSNNKKNLITYMPRKLTSQSNFLIYILNKYLPEDWTIKAIDNLSESEVFQLMSQSKIFLSFSTEEGFGLPPLEAALYGNLVIGYTGQSGKEYFMEPFFYEVDSENVLNFVKKTIFVIHNYQSLINNIKDKEPLMSELYSQYSFSSLKPSLKNFYDTVNSYYV